MRRFETWRDGGTNVLMRLSLLSPPLIQDIGARHYHRTHAGGLIASRPKQIGILMHWLANQREVHIKAKYQSKTWVIPNSQPLFNSYEDVELTILHEGGLGSKSFSYPWRPTTPAPHHNYKATSISVVT